MMNSMGPVAALVVLLLFGFVAFMVVRLWLALIRFLERDYRSVRRSVPPDRREPPVR